MGTSNRQDRGKGRDDCPLHPFSAKFHRLSLQRDEIELSIIPTSCGPRISFLSTPMWQRQASLLCLWTTQSSPLGCPILPGSQQHCPCHCSPWSDPLCPSPEGMKIQTACGQFRNSLRLGRKKVACTSSHCCVSNHIHCPCLRSAVGCECARVYVCACVYVCVYTYIFVHVCVCLYRGVSVN